MMRTKRALLVVGDGGGGGARQGKTQGFCTSRYLFFDNQVNVVSKAHVMMTMHGKGG